jgi:transposase-like protein
MLPKAWRRKMGKTPRSAAFKKKVALEALREDKTLSAIASKYGVHPIQVSKWKKELIDGAESLFEGKRRRRHEELISREDLERKIGQLSIELDFLKKTVAS